MEDDNDVVLEDQGHDLPRIRPQEVAHGGERFGQRDRTELTIAVAEVQLAVPLLGVEQHAPEVQDDARRPDISYVDHRGMRQWIDVAVVTPHPRSLPGQAALFQKGKN